MQRSILALALVVLLAGYGCGGKSGKPLDNEPPDTYFANVPPDSSEIPYRIVLHWYGNDCDGLVIGYEYAINDSSEGWTWLEATEDTIDFPAPNLSDLDSIWVRAMDDDSARDPTPAMRYYTATTIAPETFVLSGQVNPTVFCLPDTTSTWHGIFVPYGGEDYDGEVVGYRTRLTLPGEEPGDWSDVTTETFRRFIGLMDGMHTFEVRAVDNAGAEDPSPAQVEFNVAAHDPNTRGRVLVIDETFDGPGLTHFPNDAMVDSFYELIFSGSGCDLIPYDFSDGAVPPTHDTLANTSMIVYHSDEPVFYSHIDKTYDLLAEYMDVGGKVWLVGYMYLRKLMIDMNETFEPGEFLYEHLGLEGGATSDAKDFAGAWSPAGYDSLEIDNTKLMPGWPGMQWVATFVPRAEGTQVIYKFRSDSVSIFQDEPCAILYDRGGSSMSKIAVFGFGLYQIEVDSSGEPLATVVDNLLDWFDVKPE